jgi:queuosine precursor transporter
MSNANPHTQMPNHPFKYYDLFAVLSAAILIASNITAQKMVPVGPLVMSAAIIMFPLTYVVGDIMTEVYGYARARRVTWMSVGCMAFVTILYQATIAMPHVAEWPHQQAFATVLGNTPRLVAASITAIMAGELINSFVLAKMKIWTQGKHLWARFVASTFVGQGVDSALFFPLAFYGVLPNDVLLTAALSGWLLKTAYEAVMTPFTTLIVRRLKKIEEVDFYDYNTNFNPFKLDVDV